MIWLAATAGYCALYLGAVSLVGRDGVTRLWVGDIGLLLSPVLPIALVIARRRVWNGRALTRLGCESR